VARDRELRHLANQRIGWRARFDLGPDRSHAFWYPWCRVCERDASKQVFWLIGEGFAHLPLSDTAAAVNVQPTDHVKSYLERYPR
jgi:hypothetical protein